MYSPIIQQLIEKLMLLPSVGPKTAEQYAFSLKELDAKELQALAEAIKSLEKLTRCALCGKIPARQKEVKGVGLICEICADEKRERSILMVIESEPALESIEKTARYQGLYFILGEANEKNIKRLLQRLQTTHYSLQTPKELILAFDVTPQQELSIFEIKQAIKHAGFADLTISRLGRGLPTGADLRYADTATILGALDHREKL